MELLHENSQRPEQVDYICKKGPTADVWLDSKGGPGWHVVIFCLFWDPEEPLFSNAWYAVSASGSSKWGPEFLPHIRAHAADYIPISII